MTNLDRRSRKTRNAIKSAFWELLQSQRFDKIAIRDITEAADINRSTFYLHYYDKYDLLQQAINDLLNQFSQPNPVGTTSFHDMTLDHYMNSMDNINRNFTEFRTLFSQADLFDFQEWLADIYYQREGLSHDFSSEEAADLEFTIAYFTAAMAGTIKWWLKHDRPLPYEQTAEKLYAIHKQIFPTKKGD